MPITTETKEVRDFAAYFHYGTLGIDKTTRDLRVDVERVQDSGFVIKAFNVDT